MDRRTLLKAGAWAAPVIVSTTVVPAMTVSPTVTPSTASVDTVGEYPALRVETVDGVPLPKGTYIFSGTGFSPTADTVQSDPALPGSIYYEGAEAMVTLGDGNSLSSFTVYIVTSALGSDVDRTATLTVSLPADAGGGGATVELFEPAPELNTPSGFFGPDGSHWPARTPWVHDAFDHVIEVAAEWSAISQAIITASSLPVDETVKIAVAPGTLSTGPGWNSTDPNVLGRAAGAVGRSTRMLVVPRDGWGTVNGSGALADADSGGYAFVGLSGVAWMGFDFGGQGVMVRNSSDFAIGWGRFGRLNVTGNKTGSVSGVELVECVLPDVVDGDTDRMAFRVGDDRTIDGVAMRGCYVGPAYKPAGSGAHSDTLQTSGTGQVSNVSIADSILFSSSSAVFMTQRLSGVALSHSAFVGGLRGTGRYPIATGQHVMTQENTLWGDEDDVTTGVTVDGCLILGNIVYWQFDSVTDTVTTDVTPPAASAGAFTVDVATYGEQGDLLPQEWYDANCPLPDAARLSTVWSALA
ncbi:hypothetical protein [Microbacterium sp. UBA3394]|nr:hypothetical protein [Microbacterium sp. UBA3394]